MIYRCWIKETKYYIEWSYNWAKYADIFYMPHIFGVPFKYVIPYLDKRIKYLENHGYVPDNGVLNECGLFHDVLPCDYDYICYPLTKDNIPYYDYIVHNRFLYNLQQLKNTIERFDKEDILLCCNPLQFNAYDYEDNTARCRENKDVKAIAGSYTIQTLLEKRMIKDTVYNVLKYL